MPQLTLDQFLSTLPLTKRVERAEFHEGMRIDYNDRCPECKAPWPVPCREGCTVHEH